jgi:hypothetical protein
MQVSTTVAVKELGTGIVQNGIGYMMLNTSVFIKAVQLMGSKI